MRHLVSRDTGMALMVGVLAASLVFVVRVTPHPWNVAPVAAALLCLGALCKNRSVLLLPLLASLAADLVIGFDRWQITVVIYGAYLATWLVGRGIRTLNGVKNPLMDRLGRLGVGSMAGSVLFFIGTNWAVWMWSGIYPATWAGLGQSYVMAVPFFKHSLAGDLVFTGFFAGVVFAAARAEAWASHAVFAKEKGI